MGCEKVKECSCPKKTCVNKGKCCDCVIKHKTSGDLPNCLRDIKYEADKSQ